MNPQSALYLIPVNISEAPLETVLPAYNLEIVRQLRYMIVENVRTARRFLKKCDKTIDVDGITFYELNAHTDDFAVGGYLDALRRGEPTGVMSEAGCPAVADPGARVVEIAQREGLRVIPLVGPSSILLSLMASGFNGQGFSFNGYLPIDEKERIRVVKRLENISESENMTQIFIETPYRNNAMISLLASELRPDTLLCVAVDITDPEMEGILTLPAVKWKNCKTDYSKRPAIFLIYRPCVRNIERKRGRHVR